MSYKTHGIKIIGAGAAGLITGLRLVREGFRTVIYDRQKEIVDSTNSGGISFDSLNSLQADADFDSAPYRASHVNGIKIVYPGGGTATLRKTGYTLKRTEWLKALTDSYVKDGGELELGRSVKPENLEFDVLIGADGASSCVRNFIGGQVERNWPLEYVIKADTNKIEWLYFYPDKDFSSCYVWVFPLGGELIVGLDTSFIKIDQYMEKNNIKGEFVRRSAKMETFNGTKYQDRNVVLIGDAAGQANPLTRGGLTPIIHASKILVDCIKYGKIDDYERRVRMHPSFSPIFREANEVWSELTNNDLEFIGNTANGVNVPCDLKDRLKRLPRVLRRPRLFRKMMLLDKAFRDAHQWSF